MKYLFMLLSICLIFTSCSSLLDVPKKVAGYSIANFENETTGRFSFECNLPTKKAYNKCNLFLYENSIQTNYKNNKKLYIVASKFTLIYDYALDSTEVAFFVSEIDKNKSKIEVVSNNSQLAKFVYNKISDYIINK